MKLALEAMKGKSNEVIDPDLMMPEDRNKNSEESESEDQEQDNKNQDQTKNTMETSVDQVGGGPADSAPSPRDDNGISNITGPSPGQTPDPNKKNEDEKVKVYENDIQKVTTTVTSFLPSQNNLKFPNEKEKQEKREELDETSAKILAQTFDPKKNYIKMLHEHKNPKKRFRTREKMSYNFTKAKKARKQRKKLKR